MAYYPPSALSALVNSSPLESCTSIELLQISFNRALGRAVINVHDTFGDDILNQIGAAGPTVHGEVNIQLLQVSRAPCLARSCADEEKISELSSGIWLKKIISKQIIFVANCSRVHDKSSTGHSPNV